MRGLFKISENPNLLGPKINSIVIVIGWRCCIIKMYKSDLAEGMRGLFGSVLGRECL